jgi:hypothetical protein
MEFPAQIRDAELITMVLIEIGELKTKGFQLLQPSNSGFRLFQIRIRESRLWLQLIRLNKTYNRTHNWQFWKSSIHGSTKSF